MKKAFTMIELVFVIVIIGILASIATTKLAATRDDAKIANVIANARTLLRDTSSYYTSQGTSVWVTAKAAIVSSVTMYTDPGCSTLVTSTDQITNTFALCDEQNGDPCLVFDINQTAVNILATSNGTSIICDGVISDPAIIAISGGADNNKTTTLGGVMISR